MRTSGCSLQPPLNVEEEPCSTRWALWNTGRCFPTRLCGSSLQPGSKHHSSWQGQVSLGVCLQSHRPAGREPECAPHQQFQHAPQRCEEQPLLCARGAEDPFRRRSLLSGYSRWFSLSSHFECQPGNCFLPAVKWVSDFWSKKGLAKIQINATRIFWGFSGRKEYN